MQTLLIDNSNGRTKFALASGAEISREVRVLPTPESEEAQLNTLLQGWEYNRVALCSVVPTAAERLTRYFSSKPGKTLISVGVSATLPVDFSAYAGAATLGADRIANAVAAATLYPNTPLAVIDAGTATTIDIICPAAGGGKPRFLGGAILPGVSTMLRALHNDTAQLPQIEPLPPQHTIGKNTQEAIRSGCICGYKALVSGLIKEMEQECGQSLRLLLTGGDAALLSQLLPQALPPAPLLTLQGIALCTDAKKC